MKFKKQMEENGFPVKILFLDCDDNVLVMRYKENRRFHPLTEDGDNLSGIKKEREMLRELRKDANYYINTTNYSIWDLKKNQKNILIFEKKGLTGWLWYGIISKLELGIEHAGVVQW